MLKKPDPELAELIDFYGQEMSKRLVTESRASIEQFLNEFVTILRFTLDQQGVPIFRQYKPKTAVPIKQQENEILQALRFIESLLPSRPDSIDTQAIRTHLTPSRKYNNGIWVAEKAKIDPTARMVAPVIIGNNVTIPPNSILIYTCIASPETPTDFTPTDNFPFISIRRIEGLEHIS
jgi:hypothetical protein